MGVVLAGAWFAQRAPRRAEAAGQGAGVAMEVAEGLFAKALFLVEAAGGGGPGLFRGGVGVDQSLLGRRDGAEEGALPAGGPGLGRGETGPGRVGQAVV